MNKEQTGERVGGRKFSLESKKNTPTGWRMRVDDFSAQGKRSHMEDFRRTVQDEKTGCALSIVCDGHGAKFVAERAVDLLPEKILDALKRFQNEALSKPESKELAEVWLRMEIELKTLLINADRELYEHFKGKSSAGGSTLTAVGFMPLAKRMVFLNIGDSHTFAHGKKFAFGTVE